jgi:hypothetical protein
MKFARRVFQIAGIYGLVVLLPQFFLRAKIGRDMPPEITHPEFYYGFVGVAVAWQVLFLILATDPRRYGPMMIPAVLEKATFGIAVVVLVARGQTAMPMLAAALVDLTLGVLFVMAFFKTREVTRSTPPAPKAHGSNTP